MTRPFYRTVRHPALLLAALTLWPAWTAEAEAQSPRPRPTDERILEIGARVGLDYRQDAFLLGAQLRLPVDPWKRLEFVPGLDVTFLSGLTEYQINLDGAFNLDPSGLLYLGGGAALRNTRYLDDDGEILPDRETRTGYSIFGGLRVGPEGGSFVPHLEMRWVFVDRFEPRTIVVGVNYPIPLGF